jgi:YfiH family protein
MADLELIRPDWPAPPAVRAVATTRLAGVSRGVYASLNLGGHVDDDPAAVQTNRERLRRAGALPGEPCWLDQVHGASVVTAQPGGPPARADAGMTATAGVVCAVLTADCLPVLLCDRAGTRVAAVHAGWRGLAAGIVERAVEAFTANGVRATALLAWLGPAIGPGAYEVGEDVRTAFAAPGDAAAFRSNPAGRWQCDLYALARGRLIALGVDAVSGGGHCTYRESSWFYSHRRDGRCGRQATLIWLQPA